MSRVSSSPTVGALPTSTTRFVGRRREVAEVRQLIGEARLVTVTGVGGVGKTRLALEVAQRVRRAFAGGVCFADLATVTDGDQVPHAVAAALGLLERSARPPIEQLVDRLGDQSTLIIVDNCEHVLDSVASLVDTLLRRTQRVRVLATSRHVLTVPGEHLFALAPLPVPHPGVVSRAALVSRYEAVQLLVDRATAIQPRFAVTDANASAIAQLCAQLDGLPLAIELAATRLRTLTPDQVVHRVARRFTLLTGGTSTAHPRQQTLRSLIDWSYSLCAPRERLLWARLAIFTGSFDLAAAEGVCADEELPVESILDAIDRLVAQSIVTVEQNHESARFRLLETIRQYGRERLTEHGRDTALRHRHRDHYLAIGEQTAQRWCGPHQAADLSGLRLDHGNLQAAFETSLEETDDPRLALRLAVALRYHWYADGYLGQGRRWLDAALRLPGTDDALRADALWVAAWVCLLQGDESTAAQRLADCERIGERLHQRRAVAFATSLRGTAALFRGDLSGATERFDTALALFERESEVDGQLWTLFQLAITLSHQDRHDRASAICHHSLRLSERYGEQLCRSYTLWVLGYDTWRRGDLSGATRWVSDGLAIQRSFNDPLGAALMIELLAWIAASDGEAPLAASRLASAQSLWERIGSTIEALGPPLGVHHDSCVAQIRTAFGSRPVPSPPADRTAGVAGVIGQVLDGVGSHRGSAAHAAGGASGPSSDVSGDSRHLMPELDKRSDSGPDRSALTARELAVAELVARGLTNRDIAASLVISPRTVDGHMERILAKLGFSSRTQVAAWVSAHPRQPR